MARTEFQRDFDDQLTKLINNIPDVRKFLLGKIEELTNYFSQPKYANNVKIFVKGGSALKILKAEPNSENSVTGWSDFDNQLIINPNLPVKEWYDLYFKINNYLKVEYLPNLQRDWDTYFNARRNQGQSLFTIKRPPQLRYPEDPTKTLVLNDRFTLEADKQINSYMTLTSEYLHPMQYFDNEHTVIPDYNNSDALSLAVDKFYPPTASNINYGLLPPDTVNDYLEIDANMAALGISIEVVNDDILTVPANALDPTASSIFINHTIDKFILYRLVAKYQSRAFQPDGTAIPTPVPPFPTPPPQRGQPRYQEYVDYMNAGAKFRGELFDLSIPRRESEETINQWATIEIIPTVYNFGGGTPPIRFNIPTWEYHSLENILLILEVLIDASGSPHKFFKRVKRGATAFNEIFTSQGDAFNRIIGNIHSPYLNPLRTAYDSYNANTESEYRTLLFTIYNTLQNDYLIEGMFNSIDPGANRSAISDQILQSMTNWFGANIVPTINRQYGEIKDKVLKGNATVQGVLNTEFPVATDRSKMQNIMGFMQLFKSIHTSFSFDFTEAHISYFRNVCNFVKDLDPAISFCSFCGLLSSILDLYYKKKSDPSLADYKYFLPYVELYAYTTKVFSSAKLDSMINAIQDTAVINTVHQERLSSRDVFIGKRAEENHPIIAIIPEAGLNTLPIIIHLVSPLERNMKMFSPNTIHEESGFTILKEKEIVDYMNFKIATSIDFYMIHWLDEMRTKYMKAVTTF